MASSLFARELNELLPTSKGRIVRLVFATGLIAFDQIFLKALMTEELQRHKFPHMVLNVALWVGIPLVILSLWAMYPRHGQ